MSRGKPWEEVEPRRPRRRRPTFVSVATGDDVTNDDTVHLVAATLALAAAGLPKMKIAEILGVSRASVYRLLQVRDRLAAVVAGIDEACAAFDVDAVVAAHASAKRRRAKPGSAPRG